MRIVFILLFTQIHAFSLRTRQTFLRYNDNPRDKENLRRIDDQINRHKKVLRDLLEQKTKTIESLTGITLKTDPELFFNTLLDEEEDEFKNKANEENE